MAFSRKQLETLIENTPELKEDISGLDALEDDRIPIELVDKHQPYKGKNKGVVEVEPWEELEPMPEGEARVMTRQFLSVDGVEIEVCTNGNGKHFVRHNSKLIIAKQNQLVISVEFDTLSSKETEILKRVPKGNS